MLTHAVWSNSKLYNLRPVYSDATQLNSTSSWVASAGRYIHFADATQLNSTLSCVAIDTLTGSWRSELIGASCSRCERVDNSTSSWVELSWVASSRYRHFADATQLDVELNSTSSWVKLCRYKRAFSDVTLFGIELCPVFVDVVHSCVLPPAESRLKLQFTIL